MAKNGSTPNFDRIIEPHSWLCRWSRMTKFQSRRWMATTLENVGNAITRLSIVQLGRNLSSRMTSCPRYFRQMQLHGNGHCLATAHWTFNSYGRLEAEHVNQFWWNFINESKFRTQRESRDKTWNFLKLDGGRPPYWKSFLGHHNSAPVVQFWNVLFRWFLTSALRNHASVSVVLCSKQLVISLHEASAQRMLRVWMRSAKIFWRSTRSLMTQT